MLAYFKAHRALMLPSLDGPTRKAIYDDLAEAVENGPSALPRIGKSKHWDV
jgi:hypothetical protein